jgi:sigma-70-like protein
MVNTTGYGVRANPDMAIMGSPAITKGHLSHERQSENGMHGIIGSSPVLKTVLDQIHVVAPTDSTVLIQGEAGTDCRAWLFTIMFNVIGHHRRRWARFGEETNEGLEQTLRYTPPIPEELRDEDILTALDAIPSAFRAVVLLADVQEFSYREIAGILGVPIGTVMSRLSRGRELLRTELGDLAHSYGINKAQDESVSRA